MSLCGKKPAPGGVCQVLCWVNVRCVVRIGRRGPCVGIACVERTGENKVGPGWLGAAEGDARAGPFATAFLCELMVLLLSSSLLSLLVVAVVVVVADAAMCPKRAKKRRESDGRGF